MDRLLDRLLRRIVQTGHLNLIDAQGRLHRYGDGAGQRAKKRHIAAKLALEPGQRVLDIGSGWGGLGIYLAKCAGGHVTGVTLSTEQLAIANQRAVQEGLQHCVRKPFPQSS